MLICREAQEEQSFSHPYLDAICLPKGHLIGLHSTKSSTHSLIHYLFIIMGISDEHGSQGPTVVGISLAFAVLTFVVLSLRLFARIYVLGKMGVDDCESSSTRFSCAVY